MEKAFFKLTGSFQNPKLKQKNTESILWSALLVKNRAIFE